MIAKGVLAVKQKGALHDCPFLQDFLNRFYLSRIGIRMLQRQYIDLHEPKDGWVGVINSATCPADIAELAILDASEICDRAYSVVPPVTILGAKQLRFAYVPDHVYYILFELLKNSMRGTSVSRSADRRCAICIELSTMYCCLLHSYGGASRSQAGQAAAHSDWYIGHLASAIVRQPLKCEYARTCAVVVIAEGDMDVTIKVSDQGGGINRREVSKIWTYLYTTAQRPDIDDPRTMSGAPMVLRASEIRCSVCVLILFFA